jgi:hypothetical protein
MDRTEYQGWTREQCNRDVGLVGVAPDLIIEPVQRNGRIVARACALRCAVLAAEVRRFGL